MDDPEFRSAIDSPVLAPLVARMGGEARLMLSIQAGWDSIVAEADARMAELDPSYRALQVKEKFGGLRYYYRGSTGDAEINEAMRLIVKEAEAKAARTCEISGRDDGVLGTRRGSSWLRTLSVSLYGPQGFEPLGPDD